MTWRTSLPTSRATTTAALGIMVTVIAISVLHYVTSLHSMVLHELFKRLYYLPIVVAAVILGTRGALATSVFSTILYLPHVALQSHAWPVLAAEQYGEILMFNVVALVAGSLTDRLRLQRARYQQVAAELREAYDTLQARTEERQRIDRLVTIGRIASGIAHEIRTPLASVLGSIEILGSEFPPAHPKTEFVEIARREISRLQGVVTEFLEFAQPPPPAAQAIDLRLLAEGAARLARPALACRGLDLEVRLPDIALTVCVDAEQVQRALLNIMLVSAPALRDGRMVLRIEHTGNTARVTIQLEGATTLPPAGEIFEPFRMSGPGSGLGLATAARLLANQRGSSQADVVDGRLRYVIHLPVAESESMRLANSSRPPSLLTQPS